MVEDYKVFMSDPKRWQTSIIDLDFWYFYPKMYRYHIFLSQSCMKVVYWKLLLAVHMLHSVKLLFQNQSVDRVQFVTLPF